MLDCATGAETSPHKELKGSGPHLLFFTGMSTNEVSTSAEFS